MNNLIKVGHQYVTAFFSRGLILVASVLAATLAARSVRAASATWTGTADATWLSNANWSASPAPGVSDTATFSSSAATVSNHTTIDLSAAGVAVSNIVFDTSSAAAYTIGAGAAGSQTLTQQVLGSIAVNSTVANPQSINASVSLGTNAAAGSYYISNNSAQPLSVLGTISSAAGGTGGTKFLYVNGSGSTTITNTAPGGGTISLSMIGSGTLTLSGTLTHNGIVALSNGTVNLTGAWNRPAVANGGFFVDGTNGGPIAVLNLLPGSSAVWNGNGNSGIYVGGTINDAANLMGTVNQSGGAVQIDWNLMIGRDQVSTVTNYGFYNMSGGTLRHFNGNRFRVGQGGGGPGSSFLMYVSGTSTITVASVAIALNDNAASVNQGNPACLYISGSGVITNAGGNNNCGITIGGRLSTNTVTITDNATVFLLQGVGLGRSAASTGQGAGRVAVLNLSGNGFLQASNIVQDVNASPVGYVNFNGGTLKAQGSLATYMTGITRATMYGGGLTIDDNSASITIGQSLLAPTGTGVVSIAVSGATGYRGAPFVNIIGGNPTVPATAVANMDGNGGISSITMTCVGDGYTSAPTVTLIAPGGTYSSATATLGTSVSPSGGLTKNGAGTVTLGGGNTYTGLTTVANGTLGLSGARLGGPLTVGSGLTLAGSGASTISGSVSLGSGAKLNLSNSVAAKVTFNNGLTLNNNVLSFSLGAQSATNNIVLTGGSLAVSGVCTVNLSSAGGFGTVGNYRLISFGALANTNNFVLVATPTGPFGFTLAVVSGDLVAQVTSSLPPTAFWDGSTDSSWSTTANWAPDSAGTNAIASPPGAPTAVTFATGNAQNFSTTLGGNFTINTLTFSTTSNVTISGANTLTNINALTVNPGAGTVTISATGVTLGFDQTWLNNGSNPFTVSSVISGPSALTITGTGKTTLSGASTYTGATTVNGGTLALGVANALPAATSLTVTNATLDIGGNNGTVGGVTLSSGTITGTVGVLSSANYTAYVGTVSAILGGAGGVNKFGPGGTVTLTQTNTFTGSTFVDEGTLVVDNGGLVNVNGGSQYSSIGRQNADIGTLTVQGNGAYLVRGDFNVGDIGNSRGTLNVTGNGNVNVDRMYVGSANGGGATTIGTVNQSGGTVTIAAAADPALSLGGRASGTGNIGTGTYNLSGGLLICSNSGANAQIGSYGFGALNVSGGYAIFSNFISIARYRTTAATQPTTVGTLTVSGSGVLTQANLSAYMIVGEEGTGTLVVANSGLVYLNGNNGLVVGNINSGTGNSGSGSGTVNLNGGTLITTNVNQNLGSTNGASYFNFNGGTLRAKGPHSAFMTGLTTATVQSAGAFIDDGGFNITIGQALLDGGGGLTKLGAGILTLTGSNTYTGPTTVTAGKLIAPATMTGIGGVNIADSAALRVTAANTTQWSPTNLTLGATTGATVEFNAISNTNVPPLNVGTYTLYGSDPLKIIGGAFLTNRSYPLITYVTRNGTGTNTFRAPGGMTATLTTNNNTIYLNVINFGAQIWTGSVNTNWDIEVTTNWTVNAVPSVYGDGGLVQFDDTATTSSVKILSDVVPAAVIVSNTAKTYTFSGAAISGFGTLTKMGSGTAIMSNKNTYSGDTTISSGTIKIATDNALPSGVGNGGLIVNGTLDLAGHSNTVNGLSGSGIVDSTVAGAAVLLAGSDGSSSTYSGVLQNTAGTVALTKIGSGALSLVGNNTHSGGTKLSAGQLNINSATALGAAAGTFTINGGTIDNTTSNDLTVANNNPQVWNGDFTYAGSNANLNLGTGAVTLPGSTNLNVTVTTNNLTVAGVISGGGSGLTKNGGGTLTLLGVNQFNASMFIVNGTLAVTTIGDANAPGGPGAGAYINFGGAGPTTGTLLYTGTGDDTFKQIQFPNAAGNAVLDQSGSGMLIFESDLSVLGIGAHTFTMQGSGPGTGVVNGVISDNSAANKTTMVKAGTGVWILTAANINTGDTSISNGTLIVTSIGNAGAPGNLGAGTNINLGSSVLTGTLVYQGTGETITKVIRLAAGFGNGGATVDQSGTGLLKFLADVSTSGTSTDHLFTLQGSTSGTGEIAGAIPDATPSPHVNSTSILKTGTGLWTLSGVCSNTGSVTVNGGTLAIAGTAVITNTPTITVAAGATLDLSVHTGGGMTIAAGQTLGGSGTVKGNATIANGATLSPGVSPGTGTLTVQGNLVLNNSATLAYALGTNSDRTVVNGNLTLSGFLTVTDAGGFAAGNYTLITYTGTLGGTALLVNNPLPGGRIGTIVAGSGTVVLQVGAGDPFTTWQSQYFTGSSLNSAPGADPLGKGMSNTNQFLAGFNPTNAAAYLHITGVVKTNGGTNVRVDYLGASGDSSTTPPMASRTNVLEFTTGTVNGSYSSNNFASAGVTDILSGGVGLGTLTNMVDPGGATNVPSRFYRVRVLVP